MSERFTVLDRTFTWTTLDGVKVTLPLRVNMATWLKFTEAELDQKVMFDLFSDIAPDQVDAMLEMDTQGDFVPMFMDWRDAYSGGASPGESEPSPAK